MPEKDTCEKILFSHNDTFADIINTLLFNGEQLVKADALIDCDTSSGYKFFNELKSQDRDISKIWTEHNVKLCIIGIENQTKPDKDMPFRVIGYDGASYRGQLNGTSKERYPVITIVLYFGEKRWNTNTTLYQAFTNFPEQLKPYVNDYKINLVEVSQLTQEQVNKFKNDFRIIASYLTNHGEESKLQSDPYRIKHLSDVMNLMTAITGDSRYISSANELIQERKENVTMCEMLDRIEARGESKGEVNTQLKIAKKMLINNINPKDIHDIYDIPEEIVKQAQEDINSNKTNFFNNSSQD